MINTDELEKKMMQMCADRYREGATDAIDLLINAFNTPTDAPLKKKQIIMLLKHAKEKFEPNLQEENNG